MDTLIALKKLLLEDAAYYSSHTNEVMIRLWADALKDLPIDHIKRAQKYFRLLPERKQMPTPAEIRSFVTPAEEADVSAVRIADLVINQVRKRGYMWLDGEFIDKSILYAGSDGWYDNSDSACISVLGEEGLALVQQKGGWKRLCEEVNTSPIGVVKKQLIDSIGPILTSVKRDKVISLESSKKILTQISEINPNVRLPYKDSV